MPVYVDSAFIAYRRMKMCHMLADTEQELHDMADKIGIQRKWFQNHSIPHYDICKTKRELAISNGAIVITRRQVADLIQRHRRQLIQFQE